MYEYQRAARQRAARLRKINACHHTYEIAKETHNLVVYHCAFCGDLKFRKKGAPT